MDQRRAAAVPFTATIGGETRKFRRLSRREIVGLMDAIPVPDSDRPYLTVIDVFRWASTPAGSIAVIAAASDSTVDEVNTWAGTALEHSTIGSLIVAESVTTGDEQSLASEGENRSDPTSASGSGTS